MLWVALLWGLTVALWHQPHALALESVALHRTGAWTLQAASGGDAFNVTVPSTVLEVVAAAAEVDPLYRQGGSAAQGRAGQGSAARARTQRGRRLAAAQWQGGVGRQGWVRGGAETAEGWSQSSCESHAFSKEGKRRRLPARWLQVWRAQPERAAAGGLVFWLRL